VQRTTREAPALAVRGAVVETMGGTVGTVRGTVHGIWICRARAHTHRTAKSHPHVD